MVAAIVRLAGRVCTTSLVFAALASAQKGTFDGTWQMDPGKSHVSDSREVTLTIATGDDGVKMTMKTRKKEGQETTGECTAKLDGKAHEFTENGHKSKLTMWYNGPTLNASKEGGPAGDVTSMWKFELSPDKQTLTLTISHYEPAADDETLVFTKKSSS